MPMCEAKPSPQQTEDSVVWFALLARARMTGDAELLRQARRELEKRGLVVRIKRAPSTRREAADA